MLVCADCGDVGAADLLALTGPWALLTLPVALARGGGGGG